MADIAKPRKKIVYLDMDGVMANFEAAVPPNCGWDPPEMFVPGFFRNLPVMPGAVEGVKALLACPRLEVYIGSKHTTKATNSATEKVEWVQEHFPPLLRRMVLVCHKSLLLGDVLVDDDRDRWEGHFRGEFIHFDKKHPEWAWEGVVNYLVLGKTK